MTALLEQLAEERRRADIIAVVQPEASLDSETREQLNAYLVKGRDAESGTLGVVPITRAPMSEQTKDFLIAHWSDKNHTIVKWEGGHADDSDKPDPIMAQLETDAVDMPVEALDDKEASADYWSTLREVNAVSATPPSYDESCKLLGLDPRKPILPFMSAEFDDDGLPEKIPGSLEMNPWQVTGSGHMIDRELGPLKGGIIADTTGLGKTVQALAAIQECAYRAIANAKNGNQRKSFKMTVIVVPIGTIEVWVAEIKAHFPLLWKYLCIMHGALHSRHWYLSLVIPA